MNSSLRHPLFARLELVPLDRGRKIQEALYDTSARETSIFPTYESLVLGAVPGGHSEVWIVMVPPFRQKGLLGCRAVWAVVRSLRLGVNVGRVQGGAVQRDSRYWTPVFGFM